MRVAPLHFDHHGLGVLVGHHHALQNPLRHRLRSSPLVLAVALLRLHRLDAGDVAAHLAHARGVLELPRGALEAQVELLLLQLDQLIVELVRRQRPDLLRLHGRPFLFFSPRPVSRSGLPLDDARLDGKLRRTQAQGLAGGSLVDAVELEHDAARLDPGDPQLRRALARAHAHLVRLLGDGHVGEDADPHPARPLHGARDGAPRRLDLTRGEALRLDRLEAEGAEVQRRAALGLAVDSTFMGLAEFGAHRLQHGRISLLALGRLGLALAAPAALAIAAAAPATAAAALLGFDGTSLRGHRIVLHDLALEDPHLDADHAIGGLGEPVAEIDVRAQRVQGHAALAVPFHARDLGAAEPARAIDADAESAEPDRRLHRPFHGAAEGDAALQLLGDGLRHQGGVDLGLPALDDVEVHRRGGEPGELAAQLLDVGAFLADQHAGPGGMHSDAAFLVRALDYHLGDAGLAALLEDVVADVHVLVQQLAVLAAAGEPTAVPGAVDADAQADRIDLVTHYSASSARAASSWCCFTTTVSCENGFSMGLMRPRPRAWKRVITRFLPT